MKHVLTIDYDDETGALHANWPKNIVLALGMIEGAKVLMGQEAAGAPKAPGSHIAVVGEMPNGTPRRA